MFKLVKPLALSLLLAVPAYAHDGVHVEDAYARVSTMMSNSGAAFMVIENHAEADDRLVSASSDVAEKVELHTHKEDANGVMKMVHVEEGFVIPAKGTHLLARGGDHVMFLGLKQPLAHGDVVQVTLTFERSGDVVVDIPVDLERKPEQAMGTGEGMGEGMGQMKHSH